jgi:hypothetical protein
MVQKILIKLFLIGCFISFLPKIYLLDPSLIIISVFALGVLCSYITHRIACNDKYGSLGAIFLVAHMTLELPHMIEHVHHDGIHALLGHDLHIILDLVLLYILSGSWKYYLLYLGIVIILGVSMGKYIVIIPFIQPFVLGGIVGCVTSHLFTQKIAKPVH